MENECPFCGAGILDSERLIGGWGNPYSCGTPSYKPSKAQVDSGWSRSKLCYETELTTLRQRLAKMMIVVEAVANKKCCRMHWDNKDGVKHLMVEEAQALIDQAGEEK